MLLKSFKILFISSLSVCLLAFFTSASANQGIASLHPILKHVLPSVVQITVEKKQSSSTNFTPADSSKKRIPSMSLGSGVIIDAKHGFIVTNAHVVENEKYIIVRLKNDMRFYAKITGIAKKYDLAVIQIPVETKLTALPFAKLNSIKVGNFVTAIGSPFGLTQTVTSGTVSAIDRTTYGFVGSEQEYIQTDAAINPGNSGGPLVNMQGKMIGLNTMIVGRMGSIGLGFAIPSRTVNAISKQLIQFHDIQQGMLGVISQTLTANLANTMQSKISNGALVTEVLPNSAASKIKLQANDVITEVNNINIHSASDLKNNISIHRPGKTLKLTYYRNNKRNQNKIKLLSSSKTLEIHNTSFVSGIALQTVNEFTSNSHPLSGLLVQSIHDGSSAFLAGLHTGDIIVAINNEPTTSIKDLQSILAANTHIRLLLKIYRNNSFLFTTLHR